MTENEVRAISELGKFLLAHITELKTMVADIQKKTTDKVRNLRYENTKLRKELRLVHSMLNDAMQPPRIKPGPKKREHK